MIEYRCPHCSRFAFEAVSPVQTTIKVKCRDCKAKVTPVARGRPRHVAYECTKCGRTMHCENPVGDRTYCIACGTETLVHRPTTVTSDVQEMARIRA